MTPKFAQHIDPIFLRMFPLLERLHQGEQPSAEEQQRIIDDQIHKAEGELGQAEGTVWNLAKYAFVSWIDEVLMAAEQWFGREWWGSHFLEWKHFQSEERHERFYVKANEAANLAGGNDALENFYVCVMLGFRGIYRSDGEGRDTEARERILKKYGLPDTLETWAREMGNVIGERRKDRSSAEEAASRERSVATAQPLWGRARLLWPWLLVVLLGGLNVVYYFQYS